MYLSSHPLLQWPVLSNTTSRKAFNLRGEEFNFFFSCMLKQLHLFAPAPTSSSSSNWFWYVTTQQSSDKGLCWIFWASSTEPDFFFHFAFKGGSLQINTGTSDSIKHITLNVRQQKVILRISHPLSHLSFASKSLRDQGVFSPYGSSAHALSQSLKFICRPQPT